MKRFMLTAVPGRRPSRLRSLFAVTAVLAVTAGGTVAASSAANAAEIDTNAYYQLVARHSGKAIEVAGGATADAAAVVQQAPGSGQHQQFRFVPSGDGYYRIMARHSGKVLDVYEWNANDGAQIRQWPDVNGTNQQFQVLDSPDGYVRFRNRFSGKVLDVWELSTADGARISQYTDLGGTNQQFQLVRVGGGTQPPPAPPPGPQPPPPGPQPPPPSQGPPQPMPVSGNIASHDPSMIRTSSGYVLFSTHNGVETRTSSNRSQFTRTAAAIPGGATWAGQYNGGDPNFIWAPDVSFHNGVYWLYYSVSTFGSNRSAIGLATSTTGAPGSFVDQGMVIDSAPSSNYNAIDPSLLVDASGNWWLTFGSFWSGIKLIQLNPATGKRHATNQTIYSLASTPSTEIEGPDIVRNGQYYYLFVAWGKCCQGVNSTYEVRVGRSTSPTGPYLDRNGVDMRNGGGTSVLATHGRVRGPGGADVMSDTDGDILVYHYYDGQANGAVRLGLNRISWTGGWPVLVP